eukprot:scaffold13565_cov48-Phaeocystis_antarctica.AAC.1
MPPRARESGESTPAWDCRTDTRPPKGPARQQTASPRQAAPPLGLRSAPRPPRCASRGGGLLWAAASSAVQVVPGQRPRRQCRSRAGAVPESCRSRARCAAAALKLEVLSGDAVEHVRAWEVRRVRG